MESCFFKCFTNISLKSTPNLDKHIFKGGFMRVTRATAKMFKVYQIPWICLPVKKGANSYIFLCQTLRVFECAGSY